MRTKLVALPVLRPEAQLEGPMAALPEAMATSRQAVSSLAVGR
jgi:hypothetical protein